MRISGRWDPSLWTPAAGECLCVYDFGNIFDIRLKGCLMKTHRFVVALTLLNLALLVFTLAQLHPARAQGTAPVLRGRALEIVDEQGRVRASINVYPDSAQTYGAVSVESALLRL